MKVRLLESARRDLREGHIFYEQQEEGVGDYFLNTLFAEIDSLTRYGGIHPARLGLSYAFSEISLCNLLSD